MLNIRLPVLDGKEFYRWVRQTNDTVIQSLMTKTYELLQQRPEEKPLASAFRRIVILCDRMFK